MFTDTADFGWWYYMIAGADKSYEAGYGAAPFGDGLRTWQESAATFNLDRMRTPLLMWEVHVESAWDWYAGLRRLRKPVEYWYLPEGNHELFRVSQRLHAGQLMVDWFRFWLQGDEDPSPQKAEQYVRWRELRKLQ